MMVLTRKQGQWIEVWLDQAGEKRVKLKILGVDGGEVKVGVDAAREFPVKRGPEHDGTAEPGRKASR
jgi:sRNA-binding carbon storage regulator CsrA